MLNQENYSKSPDYLSEYFALNLVFSTFYSPIKSFDVLPHTCVWDGVSGSNLIIWATPRSTVNNTMTLSNTQGLHTHFSLCCHPFSIENISFYLAFSCSCLRLKVAISIEQIPTRLLLSFFSSFIYSLGIWDAWNWSGHRCRTTLWGSRRFYNLLVLGCAP